MPKIPVLITYETETGDIHVQSGVKDKIILLGILEAGKLFIASADLSQEEPSRIVPVTGVVNEQALRGEQSTPRVPGR